MKMYSRNHHKIISHLCPHFVQGLKFPVSSQEAGRGGGGGGGGVQTSVRKLYTRVTIDRYLLLTPFNEVNLLHTA